MKKSNKEQAWAELDKAQLNLEMELSFSRFKTCCIKMINNKHN